MGLNDSVRAAAGAWPRQLVAATTAAGAPRRLRAGADALPAVLTIGALVVLFEHPVRTLLHDWWTMPDAGHGLLLAPVGVWIAFRAGIRTDAAPQRATGLALIALGVLVRYGAGVASEPFTLRASLLLVLGGIVVWHHGSRQLLHWWLPFAVAALSIPLPEVVTQALTLPLQLRASALGATLLEMRGVPVELAGNVISVPGHELFVAEACSGLRSLTALCSVALILGGLTLGHPVSRGVLVLSAVPTAIVVNGVRVFLTGFLAVFVGERAGRGFLHATEGWLLFLVSLGVLGALASALKAVERVTHASREATNG